MEKILIYYYVHLNLSKNKMSSQFSEIICCGHFDIECDGTSEPTQSDSGSTKKTLCRPIPTRCILRLRKLFSRTEKSRDRAKSKGSAKMVANTTHIHSAQTDTTQIQDK